MVVLKHHGQKQLREQRVTSLGYTPAQMEVRAAAQGRHLEAGTEAGVTV